MQFFHHFASTEIAILEAASTATLISILAAFFRSETLQPNSRMNPIANGYLHADIIQRTPLSSINHDGTMALAYAASMCMSILGNIHSIIHPLMANLRRHWQLRSMIGQGSQHIYYVGGTGNTQVHKLDTSTRENEVIKLLTFAPRCLVARNGWVCCGGENGEFVAFQTNEKPGGGERSERNRSESTTDDESMRFLRSLVEEDGLRPSVIAALREEVPGLSTAERLREITDLIRDENRSETEPTAIERAEDEAREHVLSVLRPTVRQEITSDNNKCLVARSKTFGKERVNCITLWFPSDSPRGSGYSGAYTQPVAVLANNDKHVTIVDLEDQRSVDQLSYPDYVNRALLSPDGRLLAAICDDPYLYIHERVPKQQTEPFSVPFALRDYRTYEWKLCAKIHLDSQRKEDRTDQRGSFAACFSNTGRYLAVGTQYGVISVFETASFYEPGCDPLITIFTSSRPKQDVGAIRDMAFCPGPFDLLAWTEHRGRVGVADIRSNYISRQILDLSEYDSFEHIMVTERGSIDPRLLERNDRGELTMAESSEGGSRRAARRGAATVDSYMSSLSPNETSALEALTDYRRRARQMGDNRAPGARLIERLANRAAAAGRDAPSVRDSPYRTIQTISRVSDTVEDTHNDFPMTPRMRAFWDDTSSRQGLLRFQREPTTAASLTPDPRYLQTFRFLRHLELQLRNPTNSNEPSSLQSEQMWDAPPYLEPPAQAEPNNERSRDHLAMWNTILRARDLDADAAMVRIQRTRLAERAALNMNRVEHVHDDTLGLVWSEDGRTL